MRTIIALLLMCSVSLAADPALVIRDNGYFLLNPDSMTLTRVGSVVDQRTSPGDPDVPDDPDIPDDPTDPDDDELTARAEAIKVISVGVGTQADATAMASVTRTLADRGVSGKEAWDTTFKIVINRVAGPDTPDWNLWKEDVDSLAGNYSAQFFRDVSNGVASAWGINLAMVRSISSAARAEVDAAAAARSLDVSDGELGNPKAFDLTQLIELIRLILQILQDLGIL